MRETRRPPAPWNAWDTWLPPAGSLSRDSGDPARDLGTWAGCLTCGSPRCGGSATKKRSEPAYGHGADCRSVRSGLDRGGRRSVVSARPQGAGLPGRGLRAPGGGACVRPGGGAPGRRLRTRCRNPCSWPRLSAGKETEEAAVTCYERPKLS